MYCVSLVRIKREGRTLEVPCGKCALCMQRKRDQWTFRIEKELKDAISAHFLTLTYDDDNLPLTDSGNTLYKRDCQTFMKRLRKFDSKVSEINKSRFRTKYFITGEYGTNTDRAHYHLILLNFDKKTIESIDSIWKKGHTHIGEVNTKSIKYITKYLINRIMDEGQRIGEFNLMSKGIGAGYLEKNRSIHQNGKEYVIDNSGKKMSLPRYYKEKIKKEENSIIKEIKREKKKRQIEEKEQKEITRLSKLHKNPVKYLYEKENESLNKLIEKIDKKKKL